MRSGAMKSDVVRIRSVFPEPCFPEEGVQELSLDMGTAP